MVCDVPEQRHGDSRAGVRWGGRGRKNRGPSRLLRGGDKLRRKSELLWQTSWKEGRTCVKAGSVRDPGTLAGLLRILDG